MTKKWTDEEVNILNNNYKKSLKDLLTLLPNRTATSIDVKRFKMGLSIAKNTHWSEEEVLILKTHGSSMNNYDIQKLIPKRSILSIIGKLNSLNIRKITSFRFANDKEVVKGLETENSRIYKLDQSILINDLDNATYQILIGSVLGDGCIGLGSKGADGNRPNCLFKETHGIDQLDYLNWKHQYLKVFQPSKVTIYGKSAEFSTPSHLIFKQLRTDFYGKDNRKSYILPKYIERLDALGLLIWYLDDGYRGNWCPEITSSCFAEDDMLEATKIINNNLGLEIYVKLKKSGANKNWLPIKNIRFGAKSRDKIMLIWQELFDKLQMPECMRYKITKPAK